MLLLMLILFIHFSSSIFLFSIYLIYIFFTLNFCLFIISHTQSGKNEGTNGVHGRNKRSSPAAGWTQNILKVLGNVQKAIEKYQHLEDEIINDLDESVKREFETKSSD